MQPNLLQTNRASKIKPQQQKSLKTPSKAAVKEKENPLLAMIGAGKGHSSYASIEEVDAFIRAERDQWD